MGWIASVVFLVCTWVICCFCVVGFGLLWVGFSLGLVFLGFVIVLLCAYEFVGVLTPCVFVGGMPIWGLGRFGFAFVVS